MASNEQKPGTDMVKAIDDATTQIEEALAKCSATALAELPALKQAVTLAAGVQHLRRALTNEIMQKVIMPLQGTKLGFVTDKDQQGGYPVEVVRDCMIEGMIKGAQPINNEINIIAGNCYVAKNGLKRMVQTWPGLTNLIITPGVPQLAGDKGALISMRATWRLNGKPMEMFRGQSKDADGVVDDTRIAVRVNSGMGPDAIIGKAERKLYKAIYEQLTGGAITVDDGDAIDTVGEVVSSGPSPAPASPDQDGRRIKVGNNRKPAPVTDAETPADPPEPGSNG